MEFREFSAKTVDEAITKASIEFETSSENLEIQVISRESRIFGIWIKTCHYQSRQKRSGRDPSRRSERTGKEICSGQKRREKAGSSPCC